jgi:predicted membrane chloride channel (bestrophin family)
VTFMAIISTYLCKKFNFAANMPSGLIGVAIIFPIVFSINAAYRRREESLRYFASLKAHSVALFYAHRDWVPSKDHEDKKRIIDIIKSLLTSIKDYFLAPEEKRAEKLKSVYMVFSEISKSHEKLRENKVPANEISRANQYLRSIIIEFERMRNILQYRTPVSLKSYSTVFLNSFPILFGPYFAHLAGTFSPLVGYIIAILYSLVLVSLDNIQEVLENPYDAIGEDDLDMDIVEEYVQIMEM